MDNPAYVVKNENTLGYMITTTSMGVLHASILRGAPFGSGMSGPQHVQFAKLRPATVADFKAYRVKPPRDFNDESNAALAASLGIVS